jgi:hypothetical protein
MIGVQLRFRNGRACMIMGANAVRIPTGPAPADNRPNRPTTSQRLHVSFDLRRWALGLESKGKTGAWRCIGKNSRFAHYLVFDGKMLGIAPSGRMGKQNNAETPKQKTRFHLLCRR